MELVRYNAAKAALAECANIDECCDWADKAAALAAYGKQVNDETLENDAKRIRARAYRRMGQLMKEIPNGKTGPKKLIDPGVKKPPLTSPGVNRAFNDAIETSRTIAARQAGISAKRQATALQVANVPDQEFEAAVETDKPATVKQLAAKGRGSENDGNRRKRVSPRKMTTPMRS